MSKQISRAGAPTRDGGVVRGLGRILLGAALAGAGTTHLTVAREEFQAQVPPWFPADPDAVVLASGVVEITLGAALILARKRRVQIGWLAAAFFVIIFPGNISQWMNQVDGFGLDTDAKRFGRLFGQPLLVAWALWSTGAWRAWRRSRRASN